MATVYSLVAWGGRTGKTVTMTIASPCVVSLTNHGLRDGTGIVFSTTGALPTGVTAGTTYYTRSTATGTFNLYDTEAHAKDTANTTGRVNTSGSQSGTHTAKSALMTALFTQHSGRWGDSGSERCYDGIGSFITARNSVTNGFDVEFCEIGQKFFEYQGSGLTLGLTNAPLTIYRPTIDGVLTEAYHGGALDVGYSLYSSYNTSGNNIDIRDICFRPKDSSNNTQLLGINGLNTTVLRCGFYGLAKNGIGISLFDGGFGANIQYNLCTNLQVGIENRKGTQCVVANNTCVKNVTGINSYEATTSRYGKFFNNISIGNTTNWTAIPTTLEAATNNAGLSTDTTWKVGSGTSISLATTDFYAWGGASYAASDDFSPATSTSPQVDSATDFYRSTNLDFEMGETPSYNNGGDEARDIGCYEFDHGYGPHPATSTISLTNIASGSRVLITRGDTNAVLYNDVPGTSLDFETGYIGAFTVVIRKASASPYYREFNAGGTTAANQTSAIKVMQQLDE